MNNLHDLSSSDCSERKYIISRITSLVDFNRWTYVLSQKSTFVSFAEEKQKLSWNIHTLSKLTVYECDRIRYIMRGKFNSTSIRQLQNKRISHINRLFLSIKLLVKYVISSFTYRKKNVTVESLKKRYVSLCALQRAFQYWRSLFKFWKNVEIPRAFDNISCELISVQWMKTIS